MASGILLTSGQNFVLDLMYDYLTTSGVYVGLMQNASTPAESVQLPSGIVEVSGLGYSRPVLSGWVLTAGNDPYLQGTSVSWTVSGVWSGVYGYFVSLSASGNDAIWAQPFPATAGGDKDDGYKIYVTPKYEQMYEGEV